MEDKKMMIPSEGTELNDEELEQATGGISGANPGGAGLKSDLSGLAAATCAKCGKQITGAVTKFNGKSYCSRTCALQADASASKPKVELF